MAPVEDTKTDESAPAFPQNAETGNMEYWKHGMSLRDWFAGQALIAVGVMQANPRAAGGTAEQFARTAYEFADALLKERSKP